MRLVQNAEPDAARRRMFFDVRDEGDGITPETGEAGGQPQISIDGGAFSATGIGALNAIGNGRYFADVDPTVLITGRTIEGRYRRVGTTAETPAEDSFVVVGYDPFDIPGAVDDALAAAHGGGDWTGANVVSGTAPGEQVVPINTALIAYGAYAWSQPFQVLNYDPTGWTQVDFTIKESGATDDDSAALILIEKSNPGAGGDGLQIKNGTTAPSAAAGAIAVDDSVPNQLSFTVSLTASGFDVKPTPDGTTFVYEVTVWKGAAKEMVGHGDFTVRRSARRSTAANVP